MAGSRTARLITAAALATGLLAASTAVAAPTGEQTRFFLRQEGCAEPEPGRLSTVSGVDSADGCGWIGLPLDEVFYQLDGEVLLPLEYTTEDGVPLVLDASRQVTGVIATKSATGAVGGAGEVVVDLTLVGTRIGANGKPQTVTIGSGEFSELALPTQTVNRVPFALDVPEELGGVELTRLQLTANLRGVNVNASAQSLNGTSYVDVPTLVEDGPEGTDDTEVGEGDAGSQG